MKACVLRVTGDALRVKFGLPEGVRVLTVLHSLQRHGTYLIHLEGIGPDVKEGESLMAVTGEIKLNTEDGLSWDIA